MFGKVGGVLQKVDNTTRKMHAFSITSLDWFKGYSRTTDTLASD